jgi:Amt family ammonium transporter
MMSQIIGTVLGVTIAFVGGIIIYGGLKIFLGLRLTQEEEFNGADLSIHKVSSTPADD